jgi:hypothetical protein
LWTHILVLSLFLSLSLSLSLTLILFSSSCIKSDDGTMIKCHRCGQLGTQSKLNSHFLRSLHLLSSPSSSSVDPFALPVLPPPDTTKTILEIPKCEFCETNKAYFYCQNCSKLKYLCDDCYQIRHKNPALDSHTRVPWKPQYQNILCKEHSQECLIFCKTDSMPICTHCTYSDLHTSHETCLIETEYLITEQRIEKKLIELEKKGFDLQTVSLEANQLYQILSGKSLLEKSETNDQQSSDLDSSLVVVTSTSGVGTITQVIQEIHSHFYALRHLLQQKEDELVQLVKDKGQEKLSKLSRQVDDTAIFLSKSYIFGQYLRQNLAEMPHCWVLEHESFILEQIKRLHDNDTTGSDQQPLFLRDHVMATPEISFESVNPQDFLSNYRIHSSDVLPIQPLSNQLSFNGHLPVVVDCHSGHDDDTVTAENCHKINDFLSDPIFSSPSETRNETKAKSKYFSIAEEEPYVCHPGVTKALTILSVGAYNEKIIVGGGGGEQFHCTLEKQEIGVPPRRRMSGSGGASIGSSSSSKKHSSSRRSVTPPHFRHNSSPVAAAALSHHTHRSSTPPPKSTRSVPLPRLASGSSLQSFGSPNGNSTPKSHFYSTSSISQYTSLTPTTPPFASSPEPEDLEIFDNNDGTYTLHVITQKDGLYRLNITLADEHIRGSPFILHSEYHTGIIGSTGSAAGHFSSPYGVCYSPHTEQLYVADSSNNRIQVFSSHGEFVHAFGTHGRANGQFSWPVGLCVSHDRIYVSDNMNNRIQIFDLDGSYLNSIGVGNKTNSQLLTPYDLCCNEDLLFIADTGNKRIQVIHHTLLTSPSLSHSLDLTHSLSLSLSR